MLTATKLWSGMLSACLIFTGCSLMVDEPSNVSHRVAEIFAGAPERDLASAAARGDTRSMERSVKSGADINARGLLGITPAWWAIRNRNKASYAWLLARGARPDPQVDSISALEMAAGYEDPEFLEIALRYKPDVNRINPMNYGTALVSAIRQRRPQNVQLLIKSGANMDQDLGGDAPLWIAANLARYELVFDLLKAGAKPDLISANGKVTLSVVISGRYIDPESDQYVWRERVITLLKAKGIWASRPLGEGDRKKPLPDDLK